MKKILLLLISFFLLSCSGTRSIQKEKQIEKQFEKKEQASEKETDQKITTDQKSEETKQTEQSANKEVLQVEKSSNDTAGNTEKTNAENSQRTEKVKEYYENGNLKSEREISENLSKVTAEREAWKSTAEYWKTESSIISQNLAISMKNYDELNIAYTKSEKEKAKLSEELKIEKSSRSSDMQRDFRNNWMLMIIIGFILNWFVRLLWNNVIRQKFNL